MPGILSAMPRGRGGSALPHRGWEVGGGGCRLDGRPHPATAQQDAPEGFPQPAAPCAAPPSSRHGRTRLLPHAAAADGQKQNRSRATGAGLSVRIRGRGGPGPLLPLPGSILEEHGEVAKGPNADGLPVCGAHGPGTRDKSISGAKNGTPHPAAARPIPRDEAGPARRGPAGGCGGAAGRPPEDAAHHGYSMDAWAFWCRAVGARQPCKRVPGGQRPCARCRRGAARVAAPNGPMHPWGVSCAGTDGTRGLPSDAADFRGGGGRQGGAAAQGGAGRCGVRAAAGGVPAVPPSRALRLGLAPAHPSAIRVLVAPAAKPIPSAGACRAPGRRTGAHLTASWRSARAASRASPDKTRHSQAVPCSCPAAGLGVSSAPTVRALRSAAAERWTGSERRGGRRPGPRWIARPAPHNGEVGVGRGASMPSPAPLQQPVPPVPPVGEIGRAHV